jgi:flagellar protein FlaG
MGNDQSIALRSDKSPVGAVRGVDRHLPQAPDGENSTEEERPIDKALGTLREAADGLGVDLKFRYDADLSQVVVLVRDSSGERVLRQIPSDEALRLARLTRAGRQQLLDRLI